MYHLIKCFLETDVGQLSHYKLVDHKKHKERISEVWNLQQEFLVFVAGNVKVGFNIFNSFSILGMGYFSDMAGDLLKQRGEEQIFISLPDMYSQSLPLFKTIIMNGQVEGIYQDLQTVSDLFDFLFGNPEDHQSNYYPYLKLVSYLKEERKIKKEFTESKDVKKEEYREDEDTKDVKLEELDIQKPDEEQMSMETDTIHEEDQGDREGSEKNNDIQCFENDNGINNGVSGDTVEKATNVDIHIEASQENNHDIGCFENGNVNNNNVSEDIVEKASNFDIHKEPSPHSKKSPSKRPKTPSPLYQSIGPFLEPHIPEPQFSPEPKRRTRSGKFPLQKRIYSVEKSFKGNLCQESSTESTYLTKHKRTHSGEKPFTCEVFQKSFTNLTRHEQTPTGERPFKCDLCEKSFSRSTSLTIHKRTHSGEKLFQCDVCHQSFTQYVGLTSHKRTHSGEKPFQCDLCHISFTQSSGLTCHKRTHSGEKPFSCDLCQKSFTHSKTLTNHKRTHSGEKPFTCDLCQKRFNQSASLTIHKRTHSGERPFQCDLCQKSFTESSKLTRHKRTHSGERPFKCDLCQMSFTQSSGLTYHKRTHSGEKPFQCDVCHKSFSRSTSLTIHKRTHSGEKPF